MCDYDIGCIYDTIPCDHSCWGCDYGQKECPVCKSTTNYPDFECHYCEDKLIEMYDEIRNKSIIGICGLINSGKDTVASVLIEEYGYTHLSFAMVLKDAVSVIFGWDRVRLDGLTEENRMWRETEDEWWSIRLGMPITPRFAMQQVGTDLFRTHFHQDIWVATLERKIAEYDKVVITDARFPNEIKSILDMGGLMWQVKRGENPNWFYLAERYNQSTPDKKEQMKELQLDPESFGVHPSEYSWVGQHVDETIENNTDIGSLVEIVKNLAVCYNFPPAESLC